MREAIKVLDHGLVRLVEHMGSDLSVVRNARVSYNAEWRAGEDEGKDTKLINYLVKNHHTSPFEAVCFTFEVKAPIFVLRQWHRHRTWAYNEISARYAELPEEFYVPLEAQIGVQNASNKQMRDTIEAAEDIAGFVPNQRDSDAASLIRHHGQQAFANYRALLAAEVPREIARSVLPVGTYSHMFATVNLHNLMKFLKLRLHSHSQYEIRVYAQAMLELVEPIVPVTVAAFRTHLFGETK
jgi:thymidylate synthase (FAD)